MNILFTVYTYYPMKDGVQAVTGYLAEGLVKKGHKVTVITPCFGEEEKEVHNGVFIERVNIWTKHACYFGDKKKYVKLIKEKTKEMDVMINVCTQNPMTDLLFPIIDEIACKKILYMHGMYERKWNWTMINTISDIGHKIWNNIRWGIYYKKGYKYFKSYDKIIQLHRFDQGYLYFQNAYNIKSTAIENAAENVFFSNIVKTEKAPQKHYAICVANYMERKNQEFVLKAFYLANLDSEFELIFIGSEKNEYYEKLSKLNEIYKNKYGEKRVKLLANIDRETTVRYVKNADVYLMGSKWEAFPISIVESMAAGIPFISTNVGCVRFLPGGIVIDNENEMAYWLELLQKNENCKCEMGQTGRIYAEKNLSVNSKVEQLEHILEEC